VAVATAAGEGLGAEQEARDDSAARAEAEAALERLWSSAGEKLSLDPPGFVRDMTGSPEEAAEFVARWRGMGLPLDEGLMQAVLGDLNRPDMEAPHARKV
jgi:hypothetical protein